MSTQVIRIAGYSKGSLTCIGNECDRKEGIEHRNSDIIPKRTVLNQSYKDVSDGCSFYSEHAQILTALNAQYKEIKKGIAFEGMIITADLDFFEKMGYTTDRKPPREVKEFFDKSYKWALDQIGYNGTDKNIISAKVHYDERTPHMHIYYLPVTDKWQEKIYAKDENGKVLRSGKGTPLQAKDEKGKILYKQIEDKTAPKLSRTEFWRQKGGKVSYRRMQDDFQEKIGKSYGLERGEVGSDREHETKYQHKQKELQADLKPFMDMKIKTEVWNVQEKKLPFGKSIVDTDALSMTKNQSYAYSINRDKIINLESEQQALNDCQSELEREKEQLLKERTELLVEQQRVKEIYQRQLDVNQLLERSERELMEEKKKIGSIMHENSSLRLSVADKVETISCKEKAIQALKKANRGAYESIMNIVKAVGMLEYDKNEDYKADLTPQQKLLVDGIRNYAVKLAEHDGYIELAKQMKERICISRGIQYNMDEISPSISRGGLTL